MKIIVSLSKEKRSANFVHAVTSRRFSPVIGEQLATLVTKNVNQVVKKLAPKVAVTEVRYRKGTNFVPGEIQVSVSFESGSGDWKGLDLKSFQKAFYASLSTSPSNNLKIDATVSVSEVTAASKNAVKRDNVYFVRLKTITSGWALPATVVPKYEKFYEQIIATLNAAGFAAKRVKVPPFTTRNDLGIVVKNPDNIPVATLASRMAKILKGIQPMSLSTKATLVDQFSKPSWK